MRPCVLITIYDHGQAIGAVIDGLEAYRLPCIIIDDGSHAETREALNKLTSQYPWLEMRRFSSNRGRGAALRFGYELAAARGYTHAVQIDADGQHDTRDVARLLHAAETRPDALVLGSPLFDESAPRLRFFGRQFSRGLVWLETLSFAIEDPLCGLRCMPLEPTLAALRERRMGDHMEFEPEIAVRLLWNGVPVVNVPVRVVYFKGGLSHFDPWLDTWRIAGVHARLVVGMLPRSPRLLLRGAFGRT